MRKTETIAAAGGFGVPAAYEIEGAKRVVLMAHGFGSNKCGSTPLFMMEGFRKAGLGYYSFDFPGHGDSELDGDGLTVQACIDSYAAAEARIHALAPEAEVVYFGSSFGGYITLLYLAERPHSGEKAFLRAAAVRMPEIVRRIAAEDADFEKKGYTMIYDYARPLKLTRAICEDMAAHDVFREYEVEDVALYFVHGGEDSVAPVRDVKDFSMDRPASLIVIPGEEHRIAGPGWPEKVRQIAVEFFLESDIG